jgi:hypothetical protein
MWELFLPHPVFCLDLALSFFQFMALISFENIFEAPRA